MAVRLLVHCYDMACSPTPILEKCRELEQQLKMDGYSLIFKHPVSKVSFVYVELATEMEVIQFKLTYL